jgi:Tol biopolymer transport system component
MSAVARVRLLRALGAVGGIVCAFALAAAEGESAAAAFDGGTSVAGCCDEAAWSPDGRDVAFTARGGRVGEVFIVRADGSRVRRAAPASDREYRHAQSGARTSPVWSPDSSRLAFSEELEGYDDDVSYWNWRVQSVSREGGALRTEHPNALLPSWSPGGRFLAVAEGEREGYPGDPVERRITLIDLHGREDHRILVRSRCLGSQVQGGHQPGYPGCPDAPRWSPAGGLVAYVKPQYVRGLDEPFEHSHDVLRLVRTDGTRDRAIAQIPCVACFSWAPDGRRIAYMDRRGKLVIAHVHTGARRRTQLAVNWQPLWSPDGRRIAMTRYRASRRTSCLAVASLPALRARTLLCRPSASLGTGSWAPDGRRLAIAVRGGILIVRADTGATRLIRIGAR